MGGKLGNGISRDQLVFRADLNGSLWSLERGLDVTCEFSERLVHRRKTGPAVGNQPFPFGFDPIFDGSGEAEKVERF